MLLKALDRVETDEVAVVDTPPGNERVLVKAIEKADAVVIPTRIGGVETARVEAVLELVPTKTPVGLVDLLGSHVHARLPGRRRARGRKRTCPCGRACRNVSRSRRAPKAGSRPTGSTRTARAWRRVLRSAPTSSTSART